MRSPPPVGERFGVPQPDAHDAPLLLREWGTDGFELLPHAPVDAGGGWLIGTSVDCAFRVTDRLSAPRHAQVMRQGERWWIRDLGTGHGIRRDGVPCREFVIAPGVEIGIGATVLVAETVRLVALRGFVQRILGWGGDRMRVVDHALRAMRQLTAQRSPIILSGEGDMVPVAESLHRLALGEAAPFVLCDPRRENAAASVRSPANRTRGVEALGAAVGGSVCIRRFRMPPDLEELMQHTLAPESEVCLFVCASLSRGPSTTLASSMTIELPPLRLREIELPRIVEDYAADAVRTLAAPPSCFTDDDRWWVMRHSARTLPEIAKGTLRVVALNTSSSFSDAAARLGMASVSLVRWIGRRAPLPHARASIPRRLEPATPRSTRGSRTRAATSDQASDDVTGNDLR